MTDVEDFASFVRAYEHMVYALAVRLLGNPADAEDVSQTVFLRAFERFREIGGSPSVAGWLKTVTRNLCLNHLSRYRSRWRLFSELGSGRDADTPVEETFAASGSVAGDLERRDEQMQLERALRGLPDHQRVPLVLFHFEEMSYQAIAEVLGVSLSKVKTDIHRGRDALRQHIEGSHAAR
jgi:RNA polymerase sigma-70 factor (ECF subfamily)